MLYYIHGALLTPSVQRGTLTDASTHRPHTPSSDPLPHPHTTKMSSKRKWDQAAPALDADSPAKAPKTDEGKTASEAAAAAAAIAAKIAAQFAGAGTNGTMLGPKDPHDGDFTHDIDINDVRNRYLLTKGSTQTQVRVSLTLYMERGVDGLVLGGARGDDDDEWVDS